jgi:hypothetical protein
MTKQDHDHIDLNNVFKKSRTELVPKFDNKSFSEVLIQKKAEAENPTMVVYRRLAEQTSEKYAAIARQNGIVGIDINLSPKRQALIKAFRG